ncbi:MAG: succinate dehydrogenase cytochrome b subunit [Candidatus Neomarinimicrobiota bacterium]|jgi:succinate dehydrogenase / fumarate reductase cytochrome b subunit|nr:succinate dehydrogenase cytochrome b subunit [Candidatus Neomarinimicrobiota bacterium]|tara:strand:+ start:1095 stop:1763 length:669 start_codon:yes stop_codon:yes gene_type:complete
MTNLKSFLSSTIGKKVLVAITGILFCLFLLFHLVNNLVIYTGEENFNYLVSSLEKIKPLIRLLEVVLLTILVVHISNSVYLSIQSRKSGNQTSLSNVKKPNAPLSSRTMLFTGSVLFIFIVVHLSTFWFNFQLTDDHDAYYNMVTNSAIGFGNIFITILYLVAMVILGFHLKHGFSSAIQTLGIKDTSIGKVVSTIGVVFWLFIPAGFFSIAFWFGILNGGS